MAKVSLALRLTKFSAREAMSFLIWIAFSWILLQFTTLGQWTQYGFALYWADVASKILGKSALTPEVKLKLIRRGIWLINHPIILYIGLYLLTRVVYSVAGGISRIFKAIGKKLVLK